MIRGIRKENMDKPMVNEKLMEILKEFRMAEWITTNDKSDTDEKIDRRLRQAHDQIIELFREDKLLEALKRLVERIDFNGGIGEYKGGPAFVMKEAREAITEAEKKITAL